MICSENEVTGGVISSCRRLRGAAAEDRKETRTGRQEGEEDRTDMQRTRVTSGLSTVTQ